MPYHMGVHEALEAWQQGEITYRRALRLVGAETIAELYAAAYSSGVEIRPIGSPRELMLSRRAIKLIDGQIDAMLSAASDGVRR
jgi:hypothetical protein